MNLKPAEFWKLQPGELSDLHDGYKWRERAELTRMAWMTANLMNATGNYKRRVRTEDLLPREFSSKPVSIEDVQKELHERQKRFEAAAEKRGLKAVINGKQKVA